MKKGRAIAKAMLRIYEKQGGDPAKFGDSVIAYLRERKLGYLSTSMLKHINFEDEARQKHRELHIESSHEIDKESVENIAGLLGADVALARGVVRSDLVGGFIARSGYKEVDASMRTYLRELKAKLLKS